MQAQRTSDRIRVYRNGDWPENYPWQWTAALEEWDAEGQDYCILDHADGDSSSEALDELRRENRRASRVPREAVDIS